MTEPLTHARIGWDNIARRGTVSASTEAAGFPASAAGNELTYSYWKPTSISSTWEVALARKETVNFLGLAAHDVGSVRARVVLQGFISGAWTDLSEILSRGAVGDIGSFENGLGSDGGIATTGSGSLRLGTAATGEDIFNSSGKREAKFGTQSMTVEPAATNLLSQNIRDAGEDGTTNGFTLSEGDFLFSVTNTAVQGSRCIQALWTELGMTFQARVTPDAVTGITASAPYTLSAYVQVAEDGDVIQLRLADDVDTTGNTVSKSDTLAGEWYRLEVTHTMNGSATEARMEIKGSGDVNSSIYMDALQLEAGSIATTWADGSRAAGGLGWRHEYLFHDLNGEFSCNVWVRLPSTNPSADQVIVDIYEGVASPSGNNRVLLRRPSGANNLELVVYDDNGDSQTTSHGGTPWDGDWHMVTVVVSQAAGTQTLYFDGSSVDSDPVPGPIDWTTIDRCYVGNSKANNLLGGEGSPGLLDDLLVLGDAATAATVTAWYGLGDAMTAIDAGFEYEDDRPQMRLYSPATSTKFRISVSGAVPTIGVIAIGNALEMTRPIYGGHSPISLSRNTVIRPNMSERGQFLGRSIVRAGSAGSWSWRHLEAQWVRDNFDEFIEAARLYPFFLLWRPATFPTEGAYVWTKKDIVPSNMGIRDLMQVTVEAEGLGLE